MSLPVNPEPGAPISARLRRIATRRTGSAAVLCASIVLLAQASSSPARAQPSRAAAAASAVSVVQLLGSRVAAVKRRDGGVPVLLPTTMPLPRPDYEASRAHNGGYGLEIDGEEPCDGANVCLYALFTGQRGGKLFGKPVKLSHGIQGRFADIQCGAACSPASIDWIENGVLYTIEANPSVEYHPSVPHDALLAVFEAAADQAIAAGPR